MKKAIVQPPKLLYSVPDIAASTGISQRKIWELVKDGAIEIRRVGSRVVVTEEAVRKFIDNLPKAA